MQERFRLATYYLTDLAFQASRDELLGWGEFMERYIDPVDNPASRTTR
jgi:hypothetical protein